MEGRTAPGRNETRRHAVTERRTPGVRCTRTQLDEIPRLPQLPHPVAREGDGSHKRTRPGKRPATVHITNRHVKQRLINIKFGTPTTHSRQKSLSPYWPHAHPDPPKTRPKRAPHPRNDTRHRSPLQQPVGDTSRSNSGAWTTGTGYTLTSPLTTNVWIWTPPGPEKTPTR